MANRPSDWVTEFRQNTTRVLTIYDKMLGLQREYGLRWSDGLPENAFEGENGDITQNDIDNALLVVLNIFGNVTPEQETALQVVRQ